MNESHPPRQEQSFDDLRMCLEALDDLASLPAAVRRHNRRRLLSMATRMELLPFVITALVTAGAVLTDDLWDVLVYYLAGGLAAYAAAWAAVIGCLQWHLKPPDDLARVLDLRLFELNRVLGKTSLGLAPGDNSVEFTNVRELELKLRTLRQKLVEIQKSWATTTRRRGGRQSPSSSH